MMVGETLDGVDSESDGPSRSNSASYVRAVAIGVPTLALSWGAIATTRVRGASAVAPSGALDRTYLLTLFAALILLSLAVMSAIGQRKRLRHVRRERDRMILRISDAPEVGLLLLDPAMTVTFANARWTAMAGPAPTSLADAAWLKWVDPRDQTAVEEMWSTIRALHHATSCDVRYVHPIHGPGWAEVSIRPETVDGQVIGYAVRLDDISRRRQAEQAVDESERLYELLADHSNDIIVRMDLSGRASFVSSSVRRLLGHTVRELINKRLERLVHPEDLREFVSQFPIANGDRGAATAQYRLRRKGGDYVWVEADTKLVVDMPSGEAKELIASIRDIDDQRKSEERASEAEARLLEREQLLVLAESLAHIGHWRFDGASGLLECSPHLGAILKLDRETAVRPVDVIAQVHREDRPVLLRTLARARKGQAESECRVRIVLHDGRSSEIIVLAQAELSARGPVSGMSGVVRDVSQDELGRAKWARAHEAAEAAARVQSEFMATMSHEIRTPMTGVLGMIDLLRSNPGTEDRDRYFVALKQSADLLMTVIDDLLDFARIESGQIVFQQGDFDFEELIQSTLDLFSNAASQKGITLALESRLAGTASGRFHVCGDPVRIQQVLSNLLSNAIRVTDQGRVVVTLTPLDAAHQAQRWRVEVRDTGIGIADDQIAALFEPSTPDELAIPRRFGGTGLCLAISRRLIESMGGRMGVDSDLCAGSTFWFELTLPDGGVPAEGAESLPVILVTPLDILVAEDNPVNQMIVSAFLRRAGHAVTSVENGSLAVELASVRQFDCILMDMQMPIMDGLAATRAIRASGRMCANVPIIALTADASPERRRFYDNVGLTGFLTKPIDPTALADALATVATGTSDDPAIGAADIKGEPALIDLARYNELRSVLGTSQVEALLDLLVGELGHRPGRIRELFASGDYDGARAEAHSLRGAATNIGAIALGQIAAAIEATQDLGSITDALTTLDRQASRTATAIAALR